MNLAGDGLARTPPETTQPRCDRKTDERRTCTATSQFLSYEKQAAAGCRALLDLWRWSRPRSSKVAILVGLDGSVPFGRSTAQSALFVGSSDWVLSKVVLFFLSLEPFDLFLTCKGSDDVGREIVSATSACVLSPRAGG